MVRFLRIDPMVNGSSSTAANSNDYPMANTVKKHINLSTLH